MMRSVAMMLLYSAAIQGMRCKVWNEMWIRDSIEVRDNSTSEAQANLYAYDWALDKGNISTAEGYLNRSLELVAHSPPLFSTILYWTQAHFLAMHKNDAVGARAAFEKAGFSSFILAYYPLRSEAAVLFAEGRFEESRTKAKRE